jgi:hypothetical protein
MARIAVFLTVFFVASTGALTAQATADPATMADIEWSLWHQGADIWADEGNNFVSPKLAYDRLLATQNGAGKTRIIQLGPEHLYDVLPAAIEECKAQHRNFADDMKWVCFHEGQVNGLLTNARQGKFSAVRQIYHEKQKHDDNKSNVASCYNARDLTSVLQAQCGYHP